MKKKPDRVADSPMTTPYGTDVAAPAFTVPDVQGYKKAQAAEASHRFHQRYEELETAMQEISSGMRPQIVLSNLTINSGSNE